MRFPLSYAGFFAKSHILFFLRHHSDFARRSRMTAGGIAFLYDGLTCVRQHALSPHRIGTSLRVRGKLTLRKKEFIFLYERKQKTMKCPTQKSRSRREQLLSTGRYIFLYIPRVVRFVNGRFDIFFCDRTEVYFQQAKTVRRGGDAQTSSVPCF